MSGDGEGDEGDQRGWRRNSPSRRLNLAYRSPDLAMATSGRATPAMERRKELRGYREGWRRVMTSGGDAPWSGSRADQVVR